MLTMSRLSGGATVPGVDSVAMADEWARRAAADARALSMVVRQASIPYEDFGARAVAVSRAALAGFDAATADDLSPSRTTARASLTRTIAVLLAPAHAEHVATVRAQVCRSLRAALAEVDDATFVESSADIAARADLAFRTALAAATPDEFLESWRPSLDAAYAALRDDFREAFEDRDLARAPVLAPLDEDADEDDENEDEVEHEDDEVLVHPFLAARPRIRLVFNFLRPRLLQVAGLVLNVIQARAAIRAAMRAAEKRDDYLPKLPLF